MFPARPGAYSTADHRLKALAQLYATRERTDYALGELRRVLAGDLAGRDPGTD